MTTNKRDEILADEWLIVRHSGEIPEITFHSSLYYLTKDNEGPKLSLTETELQYLKEGAVQQYQEIILRDMTIENFHKNVYRGLRRVLYNWQRYKSFLERQEIVPDSFQSVAGRALVLFLEQGVAEAGESLPEQFINCSIKELNELTEKMEIATERIPSTIWQYCM